MADGIPAVPAAQRLVDHDRPSAGLYRPPAGPGAVGTTVPARLSFGQERLWFMHQLFPQAHSYHVPAAFRLRGKIDFLALQEAFTELVERHTVLRTRYRSDGAAAIIADVELAQPFIIQIINVPSGLDEECRDLITERVKAPFNLDTGPVIRADLFRIAGDDHVLLVNLHHIASDAWSLSVLAREISRLYAGGPVAPLALQYEEYAGWQRDRLGGGAGQRHLDYWRRQLAGLTPLTVPGDRPRPEVPTFSGARATVVLDAGLAGRVRALCREHRVTLYAAMMAALQVLLARCCGRDDVTVGSSMSDRGRPEFEELIGFCVNTVALRTDLSGDPPFADVARRVQAAALDAHEHVELPFERLVEELAPDRTLSRMPLFSVVMTYVSTPPVELVLPGVEVSEFAFDPGIVRYDLEWFVFDSGGEITVEVDYQTDLFDAATIGRLLDAYLSLLADAVQAPRTPVSALGPPEPMGPRGPRGVIRARAAVPAAGHAVGLANGQAAAGTERGVAALFDEIFARRGSRPDDDFFELGGHSLLAIKLVNRIRQEFGVEPSLRSLFTSSTVARLAGQIDALLASGGTGPK